MTARRKWLRFALDRELKADLVRETAYTVLVLRVVEGLAAWFLANHLAADSVLLWLSHIFFCIYFVANGVLALSYRERRPTPPLLVADVGVNFATMALAMVQTGGIESPLVLIVILKVAGYGLLFSTRVAGLGVLILALCLVAAARAAYPGIPPRVALHLGRDPAELLRSALLALSLVGGLWVFQRVAANERRVARVAADMEAKKKIIAREFESARAAAERADEAYTETVALDGVSETLSGFTESRDILNKVVEIARGVLWWDYCLILLWDDQNQLYVCSEVSGFDSVRAQQMRGLRFDPEDEPDLEWVRRLGHCAVVAPRGDMRSPSGDPLTLLTAPLYSDGEFFGVLQFARTSSQQTFTTNDLRLADRLVTRTTTALQRAKHLKEQQEADRLAAAGELAAGVAHEVNNALTGIQGQVSAVRDSQDPTTLRAALGTVEAQTHRIAVIIRELLGFGRPQQPVREAVDLAVLVDDTLTLMAHELGREHVTVTRDFPRSLKPALADRKQIQQVLVNLFTNAIHAMEPNGGSLRVAAREGQSVVYLEVHDTGSGIREDALPRIFDPFFSTKKKGTGLGLSVSFNIVRAHGGDLSADSVLGEGSTFTLRLPTPVEPKALSARSVLLVDDEPAVAASIEDMLLREGLRVRRAATGEEALAALESANFDAIFLDVKLPDISGTEVYARLLASNPALAKRVIFVTGGLWRNDRRGLRDRLPPQPMLAKPCTSEQIREVLRLVQEARAAA